MEEVPGSIRAEEIEWLLSQCSMVHTPDQLRTDYGQEADRVVEAFESRGRADLLPLLSCPGIGTRWTLFLEWLADLGGGRGPGSDLRAIFEAFAQSLGRLTTYRALALAEAGYEALKRADSILCTGRLKADSDVVAAYLRQEGLRSVLDRRMRNMGALRYDPSLSLHDHPETAVGVAEGYLHPPEQLLYRFELDLPAIEIIGWRMRDVNGDREWFLHRGIWYDPTNPRTERFALLEIPFFAARCKSTRIFSTMAEVSDYLLPFAEEQARLRQIALRSSLTSP